MNRADAFTPLVIPGSGTLFEGHFPGRPILPGIVLLHLALRAAASAGPGALAAGPEAALTTIEMLRFRRLVLPGERLEVAWRRGDAPGRATLAVRRGEERVAEAVVRFGPAGAGSLFRPAEGIAAMPAPVPPDAAAADGLLPHGPAARFIEAIRSESGDGVVCAARVPAAHPLGASGSAPALLAIEMAAQAAGIFEARRRAPGGAAAAGAETGPRLGYLVGARDVRFGRVTFPGEAACTARVRLAGVAGALTSYEFEVLCEEAPLAAGRVSTWLTATAS
jgi:3-hydroxymyristoyl/3-hydroxydecanoyl-(acyl carrier protein) dehydratase